MYALSRAAHIRPIEPDRTPSKKRRHMRRDSFLDLYDELAERSNRSSKNNVLDLSFEDVDGGHTSQSSCDEDSFEEEDNNMLCDLNWMPSTSQLPTSTLTASESAEVHCASVNIAGLSSASNNGESANSLSLSRVLVIFIFSKANSMISSPVYIIPFAYFCPFQSNCQLLRGPVVILAVVIKPQTITARNPVRMQVAQVVHGFYGTAPGYVKSGNAK